MRSRADMPKASEIIIVRKEYSSSFVLDKPKLTRMLNIIEDRFGKFQSKWVAQLKNAKSISLNSLEEVFAQDNTVKNPIVSLELSARSEEKWDSAWITFSSADDKNVELKVSSINATEADQLFAQLEEQIERTFEGNWARKFRKLLGVVGIVAIAIPIALSIVLLLPSSDTTTTYDTKIPKSVVADLAERSTVADTAEKKIDIIFEIQRQEIMATNAVETNKIPIGSLLTKRLFLIGGPLLLVFGLFVYLVLVLYPLAVFAWGDFEEHFNRILSRRRTVWTVAIVGILINVLSTFFMIGLSDLIKVN